jgi:ribosomal protein S18 acetylase RimI-like enzyme
MPIRPAAIADCRAIGDVHVACWHETYGGLLPDAFIRRHTVESREAQWRRTFQRDHVTDVFIGEAGGAIVGFAAFGPGRDSALGKDGEVYAIYILKAHQRNGLGRALFQAMARRATERRFRSMAAWVLCENTPARRFYERIGGTIAAERTLRDAGAAFVEIAYGWDNVEMLAKDEEGRARPPLS